MVQLLEVQQKAIRAANKQAGFAFYMEMGLGKTLTALTEFLELVDEKVVTRLVVVCPNSFKNGWVAEIQKQQIDVEPWVFRSGYDNEVFLRRAFNRPPVLIINYEAIRSQSTIDFIYQFIRNRGAMIVFDESIQLKNNKAKQTKSAIMLAREFRVARILSGKPITQGPHDLWGQMKVLGKLNGINYYSFRNLFCKMGGYMNKKVVGAQNEKALAGMIDPHVFRATKSEYLDLPPKLYTIRDYDMAPEQKAHYRMMEQEFITYISADENVAVDMAVTKYIKLAQIQFGFIIDEGGAVHNLVSPESNPRIAVIKEIIEEEITGKVVVCYHHRHAGEVLLAALLEYNPTFIRGQMADSEVSANRDLFNNDPNCRVICIQTVAGRYGHTLIGGSEPENHCSAMIFAENTWSLDTRSQLEDRIHRIGQKGESCLYVDLVGTDLDRKVVLALQRKQSVFEAVFQHIKGPAKA